MSENNLIILGTIIGIGVAIFIVIKFKGFVQNLAEDTLKRKGEDRQMHWSPTKLTMFSAWVVVLYSYHYDLIKNGFNETAFMVLTGVALGAKVTDAWSKKMNPLVQAPVGENKTEDGKES